MPPPPSASATATANRLATQWVIDAVAGNESLDFSVLKALVGSSSEPFAGAPEATRERVALRCLQKVSSVIAAGGDAAATARVLRVDGARSCQDVLFRLMREVGSSGKLDKHLLPPFSQDIQETICTKKLALPETSFQLLRGVDPWITSMTPPSQLEHSGTEQYDNDQSLHSSHECVNIEKHVFPTDSTEVQQETMANLINGSETGNLQKDPSAPIAALHQPSTPDSRSCAPLQEDNIDAVGLGARSPERSPIVDQNMSVGSLLASAGCDAPLQGSITEPFSQQDREEHTVTVKPQSCRQNSPNLPDSVDGEGTGDGGSSNQSSKVSSHEGLSAHATVTAGLGRISDVLPTDAPEPGHLPECITAQGTTTISQPHSRKAHPSAPQHERGKKVNQDLEDVCASFQPLEKDHDHGELTLHAASVLLSISCNGSIQGSKSETNLQLGNATEDTMVFKEQNADKSQGSKSETNLQLGNATEDKMVFKEQNADKSHLELIGVNMANQALHDEGSILKNNTVHGGLTAQTAPVSQNCNVTLHDKTSAANCFSEQKNEKDVQKDNCHTSIPSSSQNRDGESAKKTSHEENSGDTCPEICVHSMVQDINDTPEGLSQQGLCIKCHKDGQLLECSACFLVAHDSCFGSSGTYEGTNLFYCPLCIYKKATEAYEKAKKTYCEARENRDAFLGTTQVVKQHDEQLNGVQPGATNRDGHSSGCGCDTSERTHENEAYNLALEDEEPNQQRKKQKINASGNGYPKEVLIEKVPFQHSGLASMNKHSVLQNNSKMRVKDPKKKWQAGDKEAHKEAGNDTSSHETRASSQRRCDPPSNQDVEADQEDGLTASNQPGSSDELEATSSNDSGKRSSPPWRNVRHKKKMLQEKESAVSSKSRKPFATQDQHMPTSPRKRYSVHPQKRHSNPVAPTGRRKMLRWTEEETAFLREAMAKFTPQNDAQIPWTRILEYGSHVFHRIRRPSDLRVKWRNMKKNGQATDAGNLTYM